MEKYKFSSKLKITSRGGYGVDIPINVKNEFGSGGMVKVKAKISGLDYRGSLTPMGGCKHMPIVLKSIREKLGVSDGDLLEIELIQDTEPRIVKIPEDLQKLFSKNKTAKEFFNKLPFTHRKEYVKWINEAKRDETRQRRLSKTSELLLDKKHL